jgi:hypothetical protein
MASIPNDSIKDKRELDLFYRADTKRFWWIKITICLPFLGRWYYNPVRAKIVKDLRRLEMEYLIKCLSVPG